MSSEKLVGNYNRTRKEKLDSQLRREQELARNKQIGKNVVRALAVGIVLIALAHSAKTTEIMDNAERAKNVKKIEVDGVAFHDGVNARKEPFVDNIESNQLASIGDDGEVVIVDYEGDAYYYNNEEDANGGWYGFEKEQLSGELREGGYITSVDAAHLKSDKDGYIWFNEDYVTVGVVEPDKALYESLID